MHHRPCQQDSWHRASEQKLARRLLPSLSPGMLLLADRNFPGYELWGLAAATGADLVYELGLGGQPDEQIMALADRENRILISADTDFGDLLANASVLAPSVILLRRAGAQAWPERTWAVEGAAGLGHLLDQKLVAAGDRVLDVQPKLAARVRLLQTGNTGKSDPNDALSVAVAVAALRSSTRRDVIADGRASVLKVRAKRHRDLSRARNQAACGCMRCCAS